MYGKSKMTKKGILMIRDSYDFKKELCKAIKF